jgi:DNA-directed RNA polymerase
MDLRGRIYSYVHYLNYQGTDIARSLFEFVEGCILNNNNINVVYHYFANTAGKKRLTINNKIQWSKKFIDNLVNENMILVKSVLKDESDYNLPVQVTDIVKTCDEPAQLMSVYFSLINYLRDPSSSYHTPVLFDATCSGMQHLSALFSDIKLGELSNVIGNDEEIPQDVYTDISVSVKESIQKIEDESLRNIFNKIKITRRLMKRPVMTIPYNVYLNSMQEQMVQDGFFIKKFESLTVNKGYSYTVNPDIVENNELLILSSINMGKLSVILYYSVFNRLPSLQVFKKYLDDLINVLLKLNKPVVWTTPSGMTISLSNRKFKKYESKSLFIKKRSVTISLPTTSLDTRQIKISFMPNFIHSMDASNIHLLIKRLIEISDNTINLYTIHDCFASTPNFMNTINNEVKLAFIELYLNFDYLESMHNIILSQIKSYTTVYTEEYKKGEFKYNNNSLEVSQDDKDSFNYIILDNKKITIPTKPKLYDWNNNRKKFIEGIKNSLYFIN